MKKVTKIFLILSPMIVTYIVQEIDKKVGCCPGNEATGIILIIAFLLGPIFVLVVGSVFSFITRMFLNNDSFEVKSYVIPAIIVWAWTVKTVLL